MPTILAYPRRIGISPPAGKILQGPGATAQVQDGGLLVFREVIPDQLLQMVSPDPEFLRLLPRRGNISGLQVVLINPVAIIGQWI
ncbi:MAG: hypothetical protein ABSC45_10330 [Desulfobaccales bacterium]|jgi:hypothetical protein